MTITTVPSPAAFFPTGAPYSPESRPAKVYYHEFDAAKPLPLKGTRPLDDLMADYAKDEVKRSALTKARQNLAATMYRNEPGSFSALRLRAGLSQAELAERSKTSQSHVARIESGAIDPSTETVARLAKALDMASETVFSAIRYQLETRGQKA